MIGDYYKLKYLAKQIVECHQNYSEGEIISIDDVNGIHYSGKKENVIKELIINLYNGIRVFIMNTMHEIAQAEPYMYNRGIKAIEDSTELINNDSMQEIIKVYYGDENNYRLK